MYRPALFSAENKRQNCSFDPKWTKNGLLFPIEAYPAFQNLGVTALNYRNLNMPIQYVLQYVLRPRSSNILNKQYYVLYRDPQTCRRDVMNCNIYCVGHEPMYCWHDKIYYCWTHQNDICFINTYCRNGWSGNMHCPEERVYWSLQYALRDDCAKYWMKSIVLHLFRIVQGVLKIYNENSYSVVEDVGVYRFPSYWNG